MASHRCFDRSNTGLDFAPSAVVDLRQCTAPLDGFDHAGYFHKVAEVASDRYGGSVRSPSFAGCINTVPNNAKLIKKRTRCSHWSVGDRASLCCLFARSGRCKFVDACTFLLTFNIKAMRMAAHRVSLTLWLSCQMLPVPVPRMSLVAWTPRWSLSFW